ncbi:hypothetical protein IFM89_031072 [Coptis chinensis]|uniref:Uncharacterized protein n=1 Tax=Coptis chinensis TaxID=261450 RepID=A0A835H6J2_9MAGN|nr:hypothetical protein IFM89_031072 [Coptis chinensis]
MLVIHPRSLHAYRHLSANAKIDSSGSSSFFLQAYESAALENLDFVPVSLSPMGLFFLAVMIASVDSLLRNKILSTKCVNLRKREREGALDYIAQKLTRTGKASAHIDVYPFGAFLTTVLSQGDPGIAALYDKLLVSEDLWSFGEKLRTNHEETKSLLLKIAGHKEISRKKMQIQINTKSFTGYIYLYFDTVVVGVIKSVNPNGGKFTNYVAKKNCTCGSLLGGRGSK